MLKSTVHIAGFLQQVGGQFSKPPLRAATSPDAAPEVADHLSLESPNRYLQQPDGRQLALPEQGRFQIGRHADCQVQLDGDLVSRRHCQGEFRNGQLWLRDGSSNGTFVNGKQLPPNQWVEVPRGSQLGFGQSVHTLELGSRHAGETIQGPEGKVFEWPAEQQMVRVGNAEESHLKPGQANVSNHHALLRKIGDKVMVMDTQSAAGTFIAGERLKPMAWTEVPQGKGVAFGNPENNWLI
ncbi:FHA domain-containing protein [bacterium]|nr:FHA domain-containing protein [bacterium]